MSDIKDWIGQYLDRGFDGSDMYLIEGQRPTIRQRNTALAAVPDGPVLDHATIDSLIEDNPKSERLRQHIIDRGSANFSFTAGGYRLRANVSYQNGGREIRATLRVLKDSVPSLDTLGLPVDVIRPILKRKGGIILVTGITGSGKSTTMASMVMDRARRPEHIITIEDPIEYPLLELARRHEDCPADIQPQEIGADTPSYAQAVRSATRQDPDVLMIGEINNPETAAGAVEAAETGHLVIATLHTDSAYTTVERLLHLFPSQRAAELRSSLADRLRAVISQTLVPTTDNDRVLAYELMTNEGSVTPHIRDAKLEQLPNSIRDGSKYGMSLLNTTLIQLIRDKKVDMQVALEHTYDPTNLRQFRA